MLIKIKKKIKKSIIYIVLLENIQKILLIYQHQMKTFPRKLKKIIILMPYTKQRLMTLKENIEQNYVNIMKWPENVNMVRNVLMPMALKI